MNEKKLLKRKKECLYEKGIKSVGFLHVFTLSLNYIHGLYFSTEKSEIIKLNIIGKMNKK